MNKGLNTILITTTALAIGLYAGSKMNFSSIEKTAESTADAPQEKEILYWVAPMDPNFRRDKPGKSPMGMDLVPVYADEAGSGDTVTISPSVEHNLGVRTQAAARRPLWRRIEATGYVGFDEEHISHVNLRTQGWVVRLLVNSAGERVKAGDLLFELYSPELVNAQKEFLQALQRGDARLKRGAEEKLRALGMIRNEIDTLARNGQVSENIKFVAPQDGVVATLNVREGMFVQPNMTILSLADLSNVWLQAEVFESQAEWVATGQAAEARLDYLPGVVFSGQVDYVYPVLDATTRTLRVRLRFENPEEQLKPNMYARVSIFGKLRPNALTIPREALIRAPERNRVVVALGEGRFRVHEVLTGMESAQWVEILGGIEAGDKVVTSAQFLIDSEASLAGSIHRLDSYEASTDHAAPVRAFGSGWIRAVDVSGRILRVAHGPIDELGWPSMTMDFKVSPEVELEAFETGQDIQFILRQEHEGEFVIEQARPHDSPSDTTTEPLSQGMNSHEHEAPVEKRYQGEAEVIDIDRDERLLKLRHGPIEALGWPTMTMNFRLFDHVAIDQLSPGQNIHFFMQKQGERYLIDEIHVIDPAPQNQGHRHD